MTLKIQKSSRINVYKDDRRGGSQHFLSINNFSAVEITATVIET